MATTPPWKLITPEQLRDGWMEMRGATPIHHSYLVIERLPSGNYCVRNPDLHMQERELSRG